ncbi:hypothetical protein P7C73_g3324, partial [Tremellales sp. Uapishka_1]
MTVIRALPKPPTPLFSWRILLLVTGYNSLSQRIFIYLRYLGFVNVTIQFATSDEDMIKACNNYRPQVIVCPFLTKRVPDVIWKNVVTLILHPGPPGDAGPSAIDWVLTGDTGYFPNAEGALAEYTQQPMNTRVAKHERQRSHWGVTLLQAVEELDGGPVWAFDQFELPRLGSVTKSQLYQGEITAAGTRAITYGLCRLYQQHMTQCIPQDPKTWMQATALPEWKVECCSLGEEWHGGPVHDRPLLKPVSRRPNPIIHHANDYVRIIKAADSQPGATLPPLTTNSKTYLFAYGAHIHSRESDIPVELYNELGYSLFSEIPDGTILATRSGAIFLKTKPCEHAFCKSECGVGAWITHGRLPKGANTPLKPKIPMAEAIRQAGHGSVLDGVKEWHQEGFEERKGTWQQVFVRTLITGNGLAQLVYFDFYNGAFSTENCRFLLEALQWACDEKRGNVSVLALMGGQYFSNGIALNIIENASHPGGETWANINAIDDITEFLAGDTHPERSPFLKGVTPLAERGIVTIACLRGNAAAGGVALAAICDITIAARSVVINPAYRAMGLHGSELHSWSYLKRCRAWRAASMLREMTPINTHEAHLYGLIDIEVGDLTYARDTADEAFLYQIRRITHATASDLLEHPEDSGFRCAPWSQFESTRKGTSIPPQDASLVEFMCLNKLQYYKSREEPPLVHYRTEELSQMLLDSFHPMRSLRYHERRIKFICKVKAEKTPNRLALHNQPYVPDEEDQPEFDDAKHWIRGDEWKWVNQMPPSSIEHSEILRIPLYPNSSISSGFAARLNASEKAVPPPPPAVDKIFLDRRLSHVPSSTAVSSIAGLPISPPTSSGFMAKAAQLLRGGSKKGSSASMGKGGLLTPPKSNEKIKERPVSYVSNETPTKIKHRSSQPLTEMHRNSILSPEELFNQEYHRNKANTMSSKVVRALTQTGKERTPISHPFAIESKAPRPRSRMFSRPQTAAANGPAKFGTLGQAGGRNSLELKGEAREYSAPKVKNAERVEFDCYYNPPQEAGSSRA